MHNRHHQFKDQPKTTDSSTINKRKLKSRFLNFEFYNLLAIGGLFVVIIGFVGLRNYYLDYVITKRNEKVSVRVIECDTKPSISGKYKRNRYMKFEYNNKMHVKRTELKYCKKIEGQLYIEMFVNDKKNRFIFVDEFEDKINVVSSLLLITIGFFIVYKGLKEEKS